MKTALFITGIVSSLFFTKLQAQSTLEVRCYSTLSFYSSIYVDAQMVEYACINDPAFYVAVFDSTCTAWKTNYDGNGYDFGNAETGRARAESYFVFRQNNASELNGMNTMLQSLPANRPFVIYTPQLYDYATVNTFCPALTQTLFDKWGSVVQENNMMVLFGIEDQPGTFVSDNTIDGTDQEGDYILFTTELFCNTALGVSENAVDELSVIYAGNGTFSIASSELPTDLTLLDLSGRQLAFSTSGNELIAPTNLPAGTYIVNGLLNGQLWSRKVAVSW